MKDFSQRSAAARLQRDLQPMFKAASHRLAAGGKGGSSLGDRHQMRRLDEQAPRAPQWRRPALRFLLTGGDAPYPKATHLLLDAPPSGAIVLADKADVSQPARTNGGFRAP